MPINVPRYLHLDLSKHVMRNISRFRLRAHTLKVEATAWLEDRSCVCDQCPGEDKHVQNEVHALLFCQDHRVRELRKHFSFLFTPLYSCVTPYPLHLFLRTFQQPNPFCCNRSTTNLFMISFLSRTIDFFFFFLSLWICLCLAETSQQPISQTTRLKVTPHCNHCMLQKKAACRPHYIAGQSAACALNQSQRFKSNEWEVQRKKAITIITSSQIPCKIQI